jgi:hypothetical protein
VGIVLLAAAGTGVWMLTDLRSHVRETRIQDGVGGMLERLANRRTAGTDWPWSSYWPAGPVPDVIRYLRVCTAPSDRLLVTWPASEYYYFAGRAFAGGHSQLLAPRAFTAERDQELMIARIEGYSVPVVLINEAERPQFERTYPLLDRYLRDRYRPIGQFTIRGNETITIAVHEGLRASSTFGPEAWPCGFTPGTSAAPPDGEAATPRRAADPPA